MSGLLLLGCIVLGVVLYWVVVLTAVRYFIARAAARATSDHEKAPGDQ